MGFRTPHINSHRKHQNARWAPVMCVLSNSRHPMQHKHTLFFLHSVFCGDPKVSFFQCQYTASKRSATASTASAASVRQNFPHLHISHPIPLSHSSTFLAKAVVLISWRYDVCGRHITLQPPSVQSRLILPTLVHLIPNRKLQISGYLAKGG